MPARNLQRVAESGTYSHIYNRGVEGRVIFKDTQDHETFLGWLKDYLSPPPDKENSKKAFTVKGRTYRGVPHQPKNYFNKVELLAYNLTYDHFHLLLHQITAGSQAAFLRSLCTRYSMYFNKKYNRRGSLLEGPYKSAQLTDSSQISDVVRYIYTHKGVSWVKPGTTFDRDAPNGQNLPESLIMESKTQPDRSLERTPPVLERSHSESKLAVPAFIGVSILILATLLAIGARNITTVSPGSGETPLVSGTQDEEIEKEKYD